MYSLSSLWVYWGGGKSTVYFSEWNSVAEESIINYSDPSPTEKPSSPPPPPVLIAPLPFHIPYPHILPPSLLLFFFLPYLFIASPVLILVHTSHNLSSPLLCSLPFPLSYTNSPHPILLTPSPHPYSCPHASYLLTPSTLLTLPLS